MSELISQGQLVTLALVLDEDGFPKENRTFSGNVSEPQTLGEILEELEREPGAQLPLPVGKRTVVIDAGIATEDNLKLITRNQGKAQTRFSGSYYVRTNCQELCEEEIWSLYMMLTQVEYAFRCLKSELGLRPIYHQNDGRIEGHLFISVLAYHLMAAILRELKRKGINHRWETIRDQMAAQVRVTTSMTTEKGGRVYIRQTTEPEPFHYEIHRALGILPKPLRTKRLRV